MNQYNNQMTTERQKPSFAAEVTTRGFQNAILKSLGEPSRARRFTSAITSAVNTNPQLQECDTSSIVTSALLGEALDLSPSPQLGQYYLVPFKNKKTGVSNAQFILGYKGYIQLAIRSGQYQRLNVTEIKEGELIGYNPLTEEIQVNLIQDFALRDETETTGYYASFKYTNGFEKSIYWSKEQMLSHADKFSPAFNLLGYTRLLNGEVPDKDMWKYSSFWYKNFDEMAKKTLIRQLISKWGVMSIEMQNAIETDNFDNNIDNTLLQEKINHQKVENSKNIEVIDTPQDVIETKAINIEEI